MDMNHHSASFSSSSSDGSSSHYADMENGVSHLLPSTGLNSKSLHNLQGCKSSFCGAICLAVIALALSCLCLVPVGLFIFTDVLERFRFRREAVGSSQVCLPCLQISPNPLDSAPSADLWGQLDVRYDPDNDSNICCASDSAQYAVLFKLIIQRQEEVKKLADYLEPTVAVTNGDRQQDPQDTLPSSLVSAHLLFKASSVDADNNMTQDWKSPGESPMSHLNGGLQFHNKQIFIHSAGYYFIYCQLMFTPSSGPIRNPVTSFYVHRYSILHQGSQPLLLKSRHTRHLSDEDRHSSYVAGVFKLYSGDKLSVKTPYPELVSHDDVASYFGLFKLGW